MAFYRLLPKKANFFHLNLLASYILDVDFVRSWTKSSYPRKKPKNMYQKQCFFGFFHGTRRKIQHATPFDKIRRVSQRKSAHLLAFFRVYLKKSNFRQISTCPEVQQRCVPFRQISTCPRGATATRPISTNFDTCQSGATWWRGGPALRRFRAHGGEC